MSHAKFAPSAAERWLNCGLTVKLSPMYPDRSNAASEQGTFKHGVAAMHLENGTEPSDPKLRIYTEAVRSVAGEGELLVEHKVIIVPDLCEGTLDAAVITPTWFYNFDLKYGTHPVPAVDNPQQMLYGLGIVRKYELKRDHECTLAIVQPNAKSGWPVKKWNTDVATLLKFYERVKWAIDEGMKENPKAVAGHHCFWCPAKMHCNAYLISRGGKK